MARNMGAALTTAKAQKGPSTTKRKCTAMSLPSPYTSPLPATMVVICAITTPAN